MIENVLSRELLAAFSIQGSSTVAEERLFRRIWNMRISSVPHELLLDKWFERTYLKHSNLLERGKCSICELF
jgi:hypothetical protein